MKTASVVLCFNAVMGWFAAPMLVRLFRDDEQVVEVAAKAPRCQCLTLPLNAWIVLSNMALQSIGKTVRASVLSASRQGVFFIPIIWLLPRLIGLNGILVTQPISDVCAFALALPFMMSMLSEMRRGEIRLPEHELEINRKT